MCLASESERVKDLLHPKQFLEVVTVKSISIGNAQTKGFSSVYDRISRQNERFGTVLAVHTLSIHMCNLTCPIWSIAKERSLVSKQVVILMSTIMDMMRQMGEHLSTILPLTRRNTTLRV